MNLVSTVGVREGADVLEAHITYHLNAGVDHVVVADPGSSDPLREILGGFHPSQVTVVAADPTVRAAEARALLRRAAFDRGATWLIESDADEFWWPRAAVLPDVLEPIPARYTTVQALVRVFLPRPASEAPFHERMTVRTSLLDAEAEPEHLAWALRPVYRVRRGEILDGEDGRSVPLRAWYPIEVFRFPLRAPEQAASLHSTGSHDPRSRLEAAFLSGKPRDAGRRYAELVVDCERGRSDLVEDVRLRDYLRAVETGSNSARQTVPSIVEEAKYAIECAAIGEVDLAGLDRHIRELESRILNLEQRFWPRVLRRLSRMAGTPRS